MSASSRRGVHDPVSGVADARGGVVIGEAQARAMFRLRLAEMHEELLPVVRQACRIAPQQATDAQVFEWMDLAIDVALDNGMRCVSDVVAFLSLLRSVGPRFHEFPAVRQYFARADLPAEGRVLGLFEALPLAIWAVVQRHSGGAP